MTLRSHYESEGYAVVPTGIDEAVLLFARDAHGPLQPDGYHWSDGPRVFEAWKTNQAIRDIAWSDAIRSAIEDATGEVAYPMQTISFSKGTNQALHQDAVHFQTLPLGKIVGAWVALEPMDLDNGTLVVVPRSHKGGYQEWGRAPFPGKQVVGEQFAAYAEYERELGKMFDGWARKPVVCDAGAAVLWGLDLLHGGLPIVDETRTRYSLAIHYLLDSARVGWAPMFSEPARCDFHFKSTRWFDRRGELHEWGERKMAEVTLW